MLKRIFSMILISVVLCSACGSGDNNNSDVKTISISSIDGIYTINESKLINLDISGIGNQITVKSDVYELECSGVENHIQLLSKISIITLSGTDNEIFVSNDSKYVLSDTGIDNHIIEYE